MPARPLQIDSGVIREATSNGTLISPFIVQSNSVRRRTASLLEFANENGKEWSDESNQSEKPETVKKSENGRLLLHDGINLCHRALRGIRGRIAVVDKATGYPLHIC